MLCGAGVGAGVIRYRKAPMPDIHNPVDVCNPLADLSDYDFLAFVAFVWKVKQEGSYSYAEENYGPKFEAAAMQVVADDSKQLKEFYRANLKAVSSWWDTVGGDAAVELHNDHVDESEQRDQDACLWGIRCTDGYVITCNTREDRDNHVARMNADRGPGRREPAALLQRFQPGGEWNESPLPAVTS